MPGRDFAGTSRLATGRRFWAPQTRSIRWRVLRASVPVGASAKEVFLITRADRRVGEPLQAERFADRVYIDHGRRS
ncbi:MAG: hypothetical protein ABSG43_02590 [Solirubrobacteraceae bacterium]